MKASHVDGQLKLLGSKIFTVKVAFILIKHLDYKRARQLKSFLADLSAPVFHCKNRDAGSSCSCNSLLLSRCSKVIVLCCRLEGSHRGVLG